MNVSRTNQKIEVFKLLFYLFLPTSNKIIPPESSYFISSVKNFEQLHFVCYLIIMHNINIWIICYEWHSKVLLMRVNL